MGTNLQVIKEQEVLGKQFRIYGSYENPLFLAKDVAEWIEHSNPSKMLSTIDEDEKTTITISYNGSNMTTNQLFLTEDGLYEVLMQSRKPIAKQFKKEVKKILKSIRKNGGYIADQENLSDLELLAKALLVSNNIIQEKSKQIEDLSTNNRILAEEVLEWTDRAVLNKAIRVLAVKTNRLFYETWNMFYDELLYKHKINLKRRGKSPYIQHIREHEYSKVFSTLVALFEENGLNFAELENN